MARKTPKDHLEEAINILGGQAALANEIGGPSKRAQVWNWLNRDQQISGEHVIPVSKATGYRITPHQLRPDLYPHPEDGMPRETAA